MNAGLVDYGVDARIPLQFFENVLSQIDVMWPAHERSGSFLGRNVIRLIPTGKRSDHTIP